MLSHFSPVQLCVTLWTVAWQVPLSMGFFRQEYWSGLLWHPPGDLSEFETTFCWQSSIYSKLWFSSSHVQMWELDHKNISVLKKWSFQFVLLEKTLESLLYSEEIKAVNPKENQPWVFIERTDAEAPILWLPDAKSQLIGKHPDAGKDWEQKEKRVADVEMAGLYHQLIRHEFEQTLRDSEDREAWHALAHGFTKSQTQVSDWTTIYNEHTRKGKQTK